MNTRSNSFPRRVGRLPRLPTWAVDELCLHRWKGPVKSDSQNWLATFSYKILKESPKHSYYSQKPLPRKDSSKRWRVRKTTPKSPLFLFFPFAPTTPTPNAARTASDELAESVVTHEILPQLVCAAGVRFAWPNEKENEALKGDKGRAS